MQHRFFRVPARSRARPPASPMSTAQALGISVELGSLMAVGVVIGLIVGQWADQRLGTSLLFTFLGIAAGLACAGLGTLRQYRAAVRQRAGELAAAKSAAVAVPEDWRTAPGATAPHGQ
ncbi:MAG: AtpZ/AtpI family protein [Chloroflexi bacterium]|nr:AtpZ/AtpI family protein [Chloroflexota bacterium]